MPYVDSSISDIAKFGVVNRQFSQGFAAPKSFFKTQMAPGLSSLLKNKGYALKFLLNKPEVLLIKEKFLFGVSAFGIF